METQPMTRAAMTPMGEVGLGKPKVGAGWWCAMQYSGPNSTREPGSVVIGAASTLKVACRSPGPAIKSNDSRYHLRAASSLMKFTRDAIGASLVSEWPRYACFMQCFASGG
jgi:hypothetical protein